MAYSRKHGALPAGDMAALRQHGLSEVHPGDCPCRRCRRRRAALARRASPRYGQQAVPPELLGSEQES
jgi:hypothetical protein